MKRRLFAEVEESIERLQADTFNKTERVMIFEADGKPYRVVLEVS